MTVYRCSVCEALRDAETDGVGSAHGLPCCPACQPDPDDDEDPMPAPTIPSPPTAPRHPSTPNPDLYTPSGLPYGPGWWALEPHREPPQGSIVLGVSPTGTAWQRHHADSLWHSGIRGARPHSWSALCDRYAGKWAAVIYVAPPR